MVRDQGSRLVGGGWGRVGEGEEVPSSLCCLKDIMEGGQCLSVEGSQEFVASVLWYSEHVHVRVPAVHGDGAARTDGEVALAHSPAGWTDVGAQVRYP